MPTHYNGTAKEIRALNAWIKFSRAANSFSPQIKESFREYGLTESQFGVLDALIHLGPLNLKTVSEKLLCTGGNITTVVDNLEKRQFVKRISDKKDRRQIKIHLTNKGKALINKIMPGHVQVIVQEMSILSKSEQEELARLCKKLGTENNNQNSRRI